MHYVKLWSNLLKSSVLEQELHVRWLWVAMLLEADQEGNVYGTQQALARVANLSDEQTSAALAVLLAPDCNSTTGDEEGRRVLHPEPNLWHIVNYSKYRGMKNITQEREKTAKRVREYRQRKKLAAVTLVTENVPKGNDIVVNTSTSTSTSSSKKEGESEGKQKKVKRPRVGSCPPYPEAGEVQAYLDHLGEKSFTGAEFVDHYEGQAWIKGNKLPVRDWRATAREWRSRELKKIRPTGATKQPDETRDKWARATKGSEGGGK
jgi:hypothetical protein